MWPDGDRRVEERDRKHSDPVADGSYPSARSCHHRAAKKPSIPTMPDRGILAVPKKSAPDCSLFLVR